MDGKRGSFPRAFMLHLLKKFIPRRIKRIIKDWLGIFELQADSNDIDYCYRLLLGRIPDPEGRSFFLEKTKSGVLNVASLVQSFVYSEEFRKRRLFHFQPVPATGPIFVEVEGFGMYAAPDDSGVGNLLLKDGHYERHLTARFKETLRPGMVFLDIGANIGYYSLLAAKLIGSGGKVISFEPVQYNCNLLFLSARRNGFLNIDVMSMAVYERSAVFQYIDTGSNGYLKEIEESADEGLVDGLLVRTVRLDDTLKDLERLDVIKIDVEGAEYRALAGALQLLNRFRPLIFSEFSPTMLKKVSGVGGATYLEFLERLGYSISILGLDGQDIESGGHLEDIIDYYERQNTTHIDIIARPV